MEQIKIVTLYFESRRSAILTIKVRDAPPEITICRMVAEFLETGIVGDGRRRGRLRSARSDENIGIVFGKIQEHQPCEVLPNREQNHLHVPPSIQNPVNPRT